MDLASLLLLLCTALFLYCTGGSWMLQVVCYPTYALVGPDEFVPFHVEFGKRLMRAFVAPALVANLLSFVVVFYRPEGVSLMAALVVALCSIVILSTTMVFEVPRHNALDRDGKSDDLIRALVRDNIPRTISWTVGSILLITMLLNAI